MKSENLRGHACCVAPLETHPFEGEDHLCRGCGRPRALHEQDGFKALPVEDAVFLREGEHPVPLRSGWSGRPIRGQALSDDKIREYARLGYYSAEFRDARRSRWSKKGNFREVEGRLIYSP